MSTRIQLRGPDGRTFLARRGVECGLFGVYLHRMDAPDPSEDLHDHPWWFGSLVLWGGYTELRADARDPGHPQMRSRRLATWASLSRRECHRITRLNRRHCWTLVFRGRKHPEWGFYVPNEVWDVAGPSSPAGPRYQRVTSSVYQDSPRGQQRGVEDVA